MIRLPFSNKTKPNQFERERKYHIEGKRNHDLLNHTGNKKQINKCYMKIYVKNYHSPEMYDRYIQFDSSYPRVYEMTQNVRFLLAHRLNPTLA